MDIALSTRVKFGSGADATESYAYPNRFQLDEANDGTGRIVLGPAAAHVNLLSELANCLPEPFYLLYVLVVPRSDVYKAARYEAPDELSRQQVADFLFEFKEYLEFDGRHHLWIANPDHGTIVYDRHNILYGYGPLDCYAKAALSQGLQPGKVEVPGPHWHAYHHEYDGAQDRLLSKWDWLEKPLRSMDEA